jgi:hypothetical protein
VTLIASPADSCVEIASLSERRIHLHLSNKGKTNDPWGGVVGFPVVAVKTENLDETSGSNHHNRWLEPPASYLVV